MSTISVVIPSLLLPPTLKSYAVQIASFPHIAEVIVMVNAKGQDYSEHNVQWHFLGKNKGFTGACNAGAQLAKSDLLIFVNDDCTLTEEALSAMVVFLEKNPDIVATQPIVTKKLEPRAESLATSNIENIGFWVDTTIGKAFPVTKPDETKNSSNKQRVYGLSGTCLLIKKDIFEKVGMFDVSFHSYLEDVDLAIRLHKAGYKVAPCLEASVEHTHMATSSKMGLYKPLQDVKNWWRLIAKHPDVFPMSVSLLVERARNFYGLLKAR